MIYAAVHGAATVLGRIESCAEPLKIGRIAPINLDFQELGRRKMQCMLGQTLNRFRQIVGSKLAERDVDAGKVLAIERVKLRVVCGAMLGAIPPAPVASFGSKQRFFGVAQRLYCRCALSSLFVSRFRARISLSRVPKEFPGSYVLAAADPHVEVCIDPGRRKDAGVLWNLSGRRN